MGLTSTEFKRRRTDLMAQMEAGSIALIAAAPARQRSNDTDYYYRQNSDFYYLHRIRGAGGAARTDPRPQAGRNGAVLSGKRQAQRALDWQAHGPRSRAGRTRAR